MINIKDKSTESEKESVFYQRSKEVVQIWMGLAEELGGDISGDFNVYRTDLEIKLHSKSIAILGEKQQNTAQSATSYAENSHDSESTDIIYHLSGLSNYFKISKPNLLQKWATKALHKNSSTFIDHKHLLISDSEKILSQAGLLSELSPVIEHLPLRSIKLEPDKHKLHFSFAKMFMSRADFDLVFNLQKRMQAENWW